MKYITRNSIDVSSYIKKELVSRDIVILTYPKYVKESYSLIKFIARIMNNFDFSGVYLEGMPQISRDDDIIGELTKTGPLYSYDSFVELFKYFKQWEINFTELTKQSGKLLVLTDEESFDTIKKKILESYKNETVLSLVMAGTRNTIKLKDLIDNVPTGKNIASIPLKNWRFPSLTEKYNALILMGEIGHYREVSAFDLYNENNFTSAPSDFLESNKFFIESFQIKKMNNYLDKVIIEENKYLDIEVSRN